MHDQNLSRLLLLGGWGAPNNTKIRKEEYQKSLKMAEEATINPDGTQDLGDGGFGSTMGEEEGEIPLGSRVTLNSKLGC